MPNRPTLQSLLSLPPTLRTNLFGSRLHKIPCRFQSTNPPPPPPPNARIQKLISRLPRSLQPYVSPLVNAPVSHVTTFLLLHELTAIIPLIGLGAYFHYSGVLPEGLLKSEAAEKGIEKFRRYFERKGWFGLGGGGGQVVGSEGLVQGDGFVQDENESVMNSEAEMRRQQGMRIVLEVSCAYAITKLLMPLRLIVSVWATPGVARVGLRLLARIKGSMDSGRGAGAAATGGTSRTASTTAGPEAVGFGGVGKAPPGENRKVALYTIGAIAASGALFGFARLFARKPQGEGRYVSRRVGNGS